MRGHRTLEFAGKSEVRQIRFAEEEWKAAQVCGETDYGGAGAQVVVRVALRGFLKKRKYL